jgi:HSP20 family protein
MKPRGGHALAGLLRGVMGLSLDEEAGHWSPPTDVYETEEGIVVTLEIAGVSPDALSVSLERGILAVSGVREEQIPGGRRNYHKMEMRFGPFLRRVTVPCPVSVNDARAIYTHGVLTVVLPRAHSCEPGSVHVRVA